jgi:hypothetical protein
MKNPIKVVRLIEAGCFVIVGFFVKKEIFGFSFLIPPGMALGLLRDVSLEERYQHGAQRL